MGSGGSKPTQKSNLEIAIKIFDQIKHKEDDNITFSPLSIQNVLAMLVLGSGGYSRDQLLHLFGVTESEMDEVMEELGQAFQNLSSHATPVQIITANLMFVQEDCDLRDKYKMEIKQFLGARTKNLDFQDEQKSAKLINRSVDKKTKGKIRKIVKPRHLHHAMLVLVNVLYLKGQWLEPFSKINTRKNSFHVTDNKTVQATFMRKTSNVLIGKLDERTIVCLPYAGEKFSMYLVIPEKGRSDLEIDHEKFQEGLDRDKFTEEYTDLMLPKFKVKYNLNLKKVLENLGVHDVFDKKVCDLSGISKCNQPDNLFVSRAQHKVYLKVTESGTGSAASTGVVTTVATPPPGTSPTPRAHFDRPFQYFLKDEISNLIILWGRLNDPTL